MLDSISEIITYLEGIPEHLWCADVREDDNGRRCVLGHLDATVDKSVFGACDSKLRYLGINPYQLATANNGDLVNGDYVPTPNRDDSGRACKERAIAYLRDKKLHPDDGR